MHQRITDRAVAVRVIFHRIADNISHLVKSSVVQFFQRMEYASLHRLKTIANVRHGTLEDDVRSIVEIPILVHSRQMCILISGHNVAGVRRHFAIVCGQVVDIVYLILHIDVALYYFGFRRLLVVKIAVYLSNNHNLIFSIAKIRNKSEIFAYFAL